jgi:hypothetical protein
VVHLAAAADEDAQARLVARRAVPEALGRELGGRGKVVLDRADGRVQRRVEVVVEVGLAAGVPGERPAELLFPRVQLGEGCARDGREGRVARAEVAEVGDVFA